MSDAKSIAYITCIGPTNLAITWFNGKTICVDLTGWIAIGGCRLAPLQQAKRFAAAQIDADGQGLRWGEITIAATELWLIAAEQRTFSRVELAEWQAEIGLSNHEAAEFLSISLSAWNTYKAGTNPVPALVAMVCRAAMRDPILRQARYKPKKRGRPMKPDASSPKTRRG